MTGAVKWFDAEKGYGFIIPAGKGPQDRESHVFFHESSLEETSHAHPGQEVEYSLLPNYPTPRALTVRLLGKRAYVPINDHKPERGRAYGTD